MKEYLTTLASVVALGLDLYTADIGPITPTNQGVRQSAPTNPTLLQVLQNPQWYGGDAFNKVGDLLSATHPDVDFDGTRVENSCPLQPDNQCALVPRPSPGQSNSMDA
jgi:hypothetical protein